MAGVQADAEALAAAGRFEQRCELRERAAQGAAGARGVLQMQRAGLALRQRLVDDLARALDRRADVAGLGRARRAARRRAAPERVARRAATSVSDASDFSRMSGSSEAALSR